jgi:hypothetical protein
MSDAYRLTTPLQQGDIVRCKYNTCGFVEDGDIGKLCYQHHTMINCKMVPAVCGAQPYDSTTDFRIVEIPVD